MKRSVLIAVAVICLYGCRQRATKEKSEIAQSIHTPAPESSVNRILREKPFSNPALIYGTDFLSYLGATKATTGDLNILLKFTSSESMKHLKIGGVRWWWANHNINCQKKLKSVVKKSGKSYWMTYEILVNATRKILRFEVMVENDSCKIVIPDKSEWFPEQEK